MEIGVVPDPLGWEHWDAAKALLEPARARGGLDSLLDTHELLWAVLDGSELLACATARLTVKRDCEIILVGGRDRQRWMAELDRRIGAAAAEAGATRLTAYGRRGWLKELTRLGWERLGESNGFTGYARNLGG